jgi:hypothetical protein
MVPKIADAGLSNIFSNDQSQILSSSLVEG